MEVRELQGKTIEELFALSEELELNNNKHSGRDDVLRAIMSHVAKTNELHFSAGVLELLTEKIRDSRDRGDLASEQVAALQELIDVVKTRLSKME